MFYWLSKRVCLMGSWDKRIVPTEIYLSKLILVYKRWQPFIPRPKIWGLSYKMVDETIPFLRQLVNENGCALALQMEGCPFLTMQQVNQGESIPDWMQLGGRLAVPPVPQKSIVLNVWSKETTCNVAQLWKRCGTFKIARQKKEYRETFILCLLLRVVRKGVYKRLQAKRKGLLGIAETRGDGNAGDTDGKWAYPSCWPSNHPVNRYKRGEDVNSPCSDSKQASWDATHMVRPNYKPTFPSHCPIFISKKLAVRIKLSFNCSKVKLLCEKRRFQQNYELKNISENKQTSWLGFPHHQGNNTLEQNYLRGFIILLRCPARFPNSFASLVFHYYLLVFPTATFFELQCKKGSSQMECV